MKKDWFSGEFRRLVTIGDSITAGGWSTSPERCWASLLADLINRFQPKPIRLYNVGIGGNVISTKSTGYSCSGKPAGDERLEKHVIQHRPDMLVIAYGINDARGGTPPELFRDLLAGLVRKVRRRVKPLIVLVGPYHQTDFSLGGKDWSHADPAVLRLFNRVTAEVANKERCFYVDALAAMGDADWMVHYDGVHTNDLGHQVIANRIFEVLAQNCFGLARKTKKLEQRSPRWRDESTLQADYGY